MYEYRQTLQRERMTDKFERMCLLLEKVSYKGIWMEEKEEEAQSDFKQDSTQKSHENIQR